MLPLSVYTPTLNTHFISSNASKLATRPLPILSNANRTLRAIISILLLTQSETAALSNICRHLEDTGLHLHKDFMSLKVHATHAECNQCIGKKATPLAPLPNKPSHIMHTLDLLQQSMAYTYHHTNDKNNNDNDSWSDKD